MAHSQRNHNKVKHRKKLLEKCVKDIKRLAIKHLRKKNIEPHVVTLSNVALGDLRQRFSPHNTGYHGLHPALRRMESNNKFKRYPIDTTRPLEIYGFDGGLLFMRSTLIDVSAITELGKAVDRLPMLSWSLGNRRLTIAQLYALSIKNIVQFQYNISFQRLTDHL